MSTRIRPLTREDGPQILAWRNDPAISQHMYSDHPITLEEHAGWLGRMLSLDDRRGYVIEWNDRPVGAAYITEIDQDHKHAMWAFYLADPAVRGHGVGSVVEAAILRTAFEELGLHKLSCEVFDFNMAVVQMHRKFGFVDEGVFKAHKWKSGAWHDVYRLAFLEDTWAGRRDAIVAKLADQR